MHDQRAILNKQLLVVLYMYLGYAGFMILKTSMLVASPDLVAENLITKTQWGAILGWGAFGAIVGKIVSGVVADRLGGKWTFTMGLCITTISVAIFGMCSTAIGFSLVYFAALFAKSSGWPSMAKLIGNWHSPSKHGRVWGLLSTASRVGTMIALSAFGALLYVLPWQHMLWVASGIGVACVGIIFFFLKENPSPSIQVDNSRSVEHTNHPLKNTSLKQALLVFATSKRVWLIAVSMMGLTIMMDILNFLPMYLKESLDILPAEAATIALFFPAGSFISVLLGGYLFDTLSKHSVPTLVGILLTVAMGSLVVMIGMPEFGLSATGNEYATIGCLFVFGLTVAPAYYLPMSIFSIKFGGPHSGFLIAILDVVGLAATIPFNFVGGALADQDGGWVKFFMLVIAIAIISLFVTVWFLHDEAKAAERMVENVS
ncbi:MAG TPA: MFS transporter [Nitrospirales bacterium]|nr:MFS transporter [Nitrospirales bacterium]HIO69840.1 MFS transporter [Nitrospirales bacterium]